MKNKPDKNIILLLTLTIILSLVPIINLNSYILFLFFTLMNFSVMSIAWNVIGGFAGQLHFGAATFYGIGAYCSAILINAGCSPWMPIVAAILINSIIAVLIGYPCFRLRGPYFLIATLGIGELVKAIVRNVKSISGGSMGLLLNASLVYSPNILYYLSLTLFVISVIAALLIKRSRYGLRLFALNSDIEAAEAVGVNSTSSKIWAHIIMAILIGLAGAINAQYTGFVVPDAVFNFDTSIMMVLMTMVGGIGTIWGPVIGAVVLVIMRNLLLTSMPQFHLMFYGALLIVVVLLEPRGLLGIGERLFKKIVKNRRGAINE